MGLVGLSFLILGVETHGKAMAFGAEAAPAPEVRAVLGTEAR
jgi:hypothetical protein